MRIMMLALLCLGINLKAPNPVSAQIYEHRVRFLGKVHERVRLMRQEPIRNKKHRQLPEASYEPVTIACVIAGTSRIL